MPLGEITHECLFAQAKKWLTSGLFLRGLLGGVGRWKSQEGDRYSPNGWKGEVTRASQGKKVYRKGREDLHFQEF